MPHEDIGSIHLWAGGCQPADGGIQAYSHAFACSLSKLLGPSRLHVVSRNDADNPFRGTDDTIAFHGTGAWRDPLRSLAFGLSAAWNAQRRRPGLILCAHANFAPLAQWARSRLGIPYWIVAYGIEVWSRQDARFRSALMGADRILCISRYTRDRLAEEQAIPPQRLHLQHCTFDEERFLPRAKPEDLLRRYGLIAGQPVLMTVARLSAEEQYKGYDRVIEALSTVRESFPDVRYLIVGKGNDADRIRNLAAAHGVAKHVILTGFVSVEELPAHYNLCDLFVMPSNGEGFGIVFLEALASGKPVIAGNRDGSVDALCDGELGVLVDPEDTAAIARAIIGVLSGDIRPLASSSPVEMRQRVIEKFGRDAFLKSLGTHLESNSDARGAS